MKILYYDCFAGLSGDMNLGALIDIGVDQNYLFSELKKVPLTGYTISVTREKRNGIEGTKVKVILDKPAHEHIQAHGAEQQRPERNLCAIKELIMASSLSDTVKDRSIAIFTKIAEAEAKVHGMPVDKIHFHEVGAVDSIVDIVGAAICLDCLKVDKIVCSTIELGGGFASCTHGTFPVPAPATVEILKDIPVRVGTVNYETTTPTGAAILATVVDEFIDAVDFIIEKVGYGIGHREMVIPNAARVFLCRSADTAATVKDTRSEPALIIECNIDDMNPELYDHVMEKLFDNGASDVFFTPITMKKTRPAITLSVLCHTAAVDTILETLFTETSTLGIRKYPVEKVMLQRKSFKIHTQYGDVAVKSGYYKGAMVKSKPEYNDCKRIAREKNISIQEIYKAVESALKENNGT
jgi:uncharacterized protein (TIGR00299 family) protein